MSTRPVVRLTEVKATSKARDERFRPQFAGIEEIVLYNEIQALQQGAWFGDKIAILARIKNRMEAKGIYATGLEIANYLRNVSLIFQSRLAMEADTEDMLQFYHGVSVHLTSALPYTEKHPEFETPRALYAYGKRRRRPSKPKSGKKRQVIVDGQLFESIAEANRKTGKGYQYIQKSSLKAYKESFDPAKQL